MGNTVIEYCYDVVGSPITGCGSCPSSINFGSSCSITNNNYLYTGNFSLSCIQPTSRPTISPTIQPSHCPSEKPSKTPTTEPSSLPSNNPSLIPTCRPTFRPTVAPVAKTPETSAGCFAGTETVLFESGYHVAMSKVKIGDKVLVVSTRGVFTFSPVIAIPHSSTNGLLPMNAKTFSFTMLSTGSGRSLKVTNDHLIMGGSCNNSSRASMRLVEANSLKVGDCLATVDNKEVIVDVSLVSDFGIYTIVTMSNDFIVVNGVWTSPFSSNHYVPNAFYFFHRMIYKYCFNAIDILSSGLFLTSIQLFGDLVYTFF